MTNDEIKKANRKALPTFLLVVAICAIIGGIAGYCSARYGLDGMTGTLKAAGDFFGTRVAPWLMLAAAVVLPMVCVPIYRRAAGHRGSCSDLSVWLFPKRFGERLTA